MRSALRRCAAPFAVVALFAGAETLATTLMQMNLEDLCQRAGQVFRGTVLDVEDGTVEVGGGQLPTLTFVIRVDEAFKGEFPTEKEVPVIEIRTLGKLPVRKSGSVRWVPSVPGPPELTVGSSYLLFVTAPSAIGLSNTVGLGQGRFHLAGDPERETAVNEVDNLGLASPSRLVGAPPRGPIPYERLAAEIRAIVRGS